MNLKELLQNHQEGFEALADKVNQLERRIEHLEDEIALREIQLTLDKSPKIA